MPVFSIDEELIFPHPVLHEPDGLLAVGGSLSVDRLLLAYRWGIFPWYNKGYPVLWWWLAPRLMVKMDEVHVSHSLKKFLKKNGYTITVNQNFDGVIRRCASVKRKKQKGTWILPQMIEAYNALHEAGYAHSVEVYLDENLVGGIYGIALGKIFFGESMFAEKPNASKAAFIHLCAYFQKKGFEWIDCQQDTPHMRSLGGKLMEENEFLEILRENQMYMLQK